MQAVELYHFSASSIQKVASITSYEYRCLYLFHAPFSFVGFVAAVAQIYVIPPDRGARRGLRTFPFALQRS